MVSRDVLFVGHSQGWSDNVDLSGIILTADPKKAQAVMALASDWTKTRLWSGEPIGYAFFKERFSDLERLGDYLLIDVPVPEGENPSPLITDSLYAHIARLQVRSAPHSWTIDRWRSHIVSDILIPLKISYDRADDPNLGLVMLEELAHKAPPQYRDHLADYGQALRLMMMTGADVDVIAEADYLAKVICGRAPAQP